MQNSDRQYCFQFVKYSTPVSIKIMNENYTFIMFNSRFNYENFAITTFQVNFCPTIEFFLTFWVSRFFIISSCYKQFL